jgi:RHS repeat-associated protein
MKRLLLAAMAFVFLMVSDAETGPSTVLRFPDVKLNMLRVMKIVPEYLGAGKPIRLTAEVNYPKAAAEINWKLIGLSTGCRLKSTGTHTAELSVGEQGQRIKIQACIKGVDPTCGCATLDLQAVEMAFSEGEKPEQSVWDLIESREWCELACRITRKETLQYIFYKVGSTVNTVTGRYNRDETDMTIKVAGGFLEVRRWYQGDTWRWEHNRHNLSFKRDSSGILSSIRKGAVIYQRSPTRKGEFVNDIYRIVRDGEGYRWLDPGRNWKRFDAKGRLTSFGTRKGVTGRYVYQQGRLCCVVDRNHKRAFRFDYDNAGFLSAVSDRHNRRVAYQYRKGRLCEVKDLLGNRTAYKYNRAGLLSRVVEPGGRETRIAYGKKGKVKSVLDGRGRGHLFRFDHDQVRGLYYVEIRSTWGRIQEVWFDKAGEAREVRLNGRRILHVEKQGRNLVITDETGGITRKDFDERDNLTRIRYPDGSTVSYAYEPRFSRLIRAVNERGVTTKYRYDAKGNMVQRIEAYGTPVQRITEYAYDGPGNRILVCKKGDKRTREAVSSMQYDAWGNMVRKTGPEGQVTHFTYDHMGNLVTRKDPLGAVWSYAYDAAGNRISIQDPLGHVTRMVYDPSGNRVEERDAEGKETRYGYDTRNRLITSRDGAGNVTRFEYNMEGKIIRKIDPEGKSTRYTYDRAGRLKTVTDGNQNVITFGYEQASSPGCSACAGSGGKDRPTEIKYPTFVRRFRYDGRGRKIEQKDILSRKEAYSTSYRYDPTGNLITTTDRAGRKTGYTYDELNRLIKITDPKGNETVFGYDRRDNLVELQDGNGNVTRFEYDHNNRLIKEIRPMGQETAYQYDGRGTLIRKIDPKGQRTDYRHDLAGRLIGIRYFSRSHETHPIKRVTFSHDRVGNIIGYRDGISRAEYAYDDAHRKVKEIVDYGTFRKSYSYAYYRNGKKKRFTAADGSQYDYAYDGNNQLRWIKMPGANFITYPSYAWTRPKAVKLPGGSEGKYGYDPLMRITAITGMDPKGKRLLKYRYLYDNMDNILEKRTEHGTYAYGYDELSRLIRAKNPGLVDEAFTYDAVGNRLTAKETKRQWQYNANNELQAYDGVSFEYDANGNTIKKTKKGEVFQYIFNICNRLEKVTDGTGAVIASYYYDPFGRRIWKQAGDKKTYFFYSDEGLIAEYDSKGKEIRAYGYKPDSMWTTDPLFMKQGGKYYFYHNDHLGTPQKLTNLNGRVVWSATYTSFGKAHVNPKSSVTNNLRFPGQYYDEETGFHYNYFRCYSPTVGRYLVPDPSHSINPKGIGIPYVFPSLLFFPREHNHFAYVKNDPIGFFDEAGLTGYPGPGHFEKEVERLFNQLKRNIENNLPKIDKIPKTHKECLKLARQFRNDCYTRGTVACHILCTRVFPSPLVTACSTICGRLYHRLLCDSHYSSQIEWCKKRFCER